MSHTKDFPHLSKAGGIKVSRWNRRILELQKIADGDVVATIDNEEYRLSTRMTKLRFPWKNKIPSVYSYEGVGDLPSLSLIEFDIPQRVGYRKNIRITATIDSIIDTTVTLITNGRIQNKNISAGNDIVVVFDERQTGVEDVLEVELLHGDEVLTKTKVDVYIPITKAGENVIFGGIGFSGCGHSGKVTIIDFIPQ